MPSPSDFGSTPLLLQNNLYFVFHWLLKNLFLGCPTSQRWFADTWLVEFPFIWAGIFLAQEMCFHILNPWNMSALSSTVSWPAFRASWKPCLLICLCMTLERSQLKCPKLLRKAEHISLPRFLRSSCVLSWGGVLRLLLLSNGGGVPPTLTKTHPSWWSSMAWENQTRVLPLSVVCCGGKLWYISPDKWRSIRNQCCQGHQGATGIASPGWSRSFRRTFSITGKGGERYKWRFDQSRTRPSPMHMGSRPHLTQNWVHLGVPYSRKYIYERFAPSQESIVQLPFVGHRISPAERVCQIVLWTRVAEMWMLFEMQNSQISMARLHKDCETVPPWWLM